MHQCYFGIELDTDNIIKRCQNLTDKMFCDDHNESENDALYWTTVIKYLLDNTSNKNSADEKYKTIRETYFFLKLSVHNYGNLKKFIHTTLGKIMEIESFSFCEKEDYDFEFYNFKETIWNNISKETQDQSLIVTNNIINYYHEILLKSKNNQNTSNIFIKFYNYCVKNKHNIDEFVIRTLKLITSNQKYAEFIKFPEYFDLSFEKCVPKNKKEKKLTVLEI